MLEREITNVNAHWIIEWDPFCPWVCEPMPRPIQESISFFALFFVVVVGVLFLSLITPQPPAHVSVVEGVA